MKTVLRRTAEPIGGNGYSCRSPPFTLPPFNLLYLLKEKIIGTVQNLHPWQE